MGFKKMKIVCNLNINKHRDENRHGLSNVLGLHKKEKYANIEWLLNCLNKHLIGTLINVFD